MERALEDLSRKELIKAAKEKAEEMGLQMPFGSKKQFGQK